MTDVQAHLEQLVHEPAHPEAIEAVEIAFSGEGRWEELLRVYEENALRATSEQAGPLLRKAALVCLNELSSAPRAEAYLKRALEVLPNDGQSLAALRQLYLARGDYAQMVEVQEKELGRIKDPKEKSAGFVEIGELYATKLSRLDRALSALRQAERLDKENPNVHKLKAIVYSAQARFDQSQAALLKELTISGISDDLSTRLVDVAMRLLERPKFHELAAQALDAVLEADAEHVAAAQAKQELVSYETGWVDRVTDFEQRAVQLGNAEPHQAAELWLAIAELQMVYGGQSESALVSVDRALAAEPGHDSALRLMEEVYGAAERWGELAMKLEMMAAYAREPSVAVELYLKAAMHNAVRLDNADASARLYVRVLETEPGNKVASNALAEYYRERQQWDHALQVLSAWAERATQAADKVAAHYACCRILDEEINDQVRARPHYEAILALDPENQAAAMALEAVYRQSQDHPALTKVLRAKLAGIAGDARIAVLKELTGLYTGPIDDPEEALAVVGELYQLEPNATMREKLEEFAARTGDFSSLVAFIEGGMDRIEDPADQVQALHSIAALYEGAHDAPLDALRIHRRILVLAPEDERAKEAAERLLEAAAQSGDKLTFYKEQAEAASSDTERVSILHKLADELVNTAKSYVRAADVYGEILRLAPEDETAAEGLLALYRRDQRWPEVAEMLARKINNLGEDSSEGALALRLELSQIYEHHLDHPEPAVDLYLEILAADAENIDAATGLQRLLARTERTGDVAQTLKPRYETAGDWGSVADMLEILVQAESESGQRIALLEELATVYEEKLARPADALAALLRAHQAEPGSTGLQDKLERIGDIIGDYSGIVRSYRSAAMALEDEDRQSIVFRAAAVAERAKDLGGATVDYLKLLGFSDEHDKLALEGLARLLEAGADKEKIADTALNVVGTMEDEKQAPTWRLLADFYENVMSSPTDAIAAHKAVLEAMGGTDEGASTGLDRLYRSASNPQELVGYLRGKIDAATDDASRTHLVVQLADLLADKVQDLASAISELNKMAELAPGQRTLWERLTTYHRRAGHPAEAAKAMHRGINLLSEGEERRAALVDYAELVGSELNDIAGAMGALQSILAESPSDAAAISLLEVFAKASPDTGVPEDMARLLLAGYEASERWADLTQMLHARVEHMTSAHDRVEALKRLADIKASKMNDPGGAYADLERALPDAPLDAALRMDLERHAEAADAWERLAQAYTAVLAAVDDEESQKPIRRKLAEVLDKRLGRGAEAVEHYKAAGGGELPEDAESLGAMERLLREQGRPDELSNVLDAQLKHQDEGGRNKLLLELGILCEEQLADKQRAVGYLSELVEADPTHGDALRRLERMLTEFNQTERLQSVLEGLIALGSANPEILDDYIKLAGVQLQLGDAETAFQSFRAVLLKKRDHEQGIAGMEQLVAAGGDKLEIAQVLEPIYTAKQDHEKLAWILGEKLEGIEDPAQRKGIIRRIGDIYENRLGQKERAFAMARKSLGEDPADMGVRMWIEKLTGETGALADLAQVYVEEAERAEPALSLQFRRRAASIYHEKLNDGISAVDQYKAILAIEERDEKALSGLDAIFRATEDYAELVGVLNLRLELTAGLERKREYLEEIAVIQAEKLIDRDAAVATYGTLLDISPDDSAPFDAIERLLSEAAEWEKLVGFYENEERRLAEKRGREVAVRRMELVFRRACTVDDKFGDRQLAMDLFESVLVEDPDHAHTQEYLVARSAGGINEAIELLENFYRGQQQWQKLVGHLEVKLQHTAESSVRRATYLSMAETYSDSLDAGDLAFQALTRAYNENRADLELLESLESEAEKHNYWAALVQVLGTDLDAVADADLRQHLLRRLGYVCGTHLGDVQRSIAYLQAALQYQPQDLEALAELDKVLAANQMWAALADILERRAEIATEPGDKSQLLERLASVWGDNLMDAEAALRCHQQILEIDPDHPISLKSMQKLYAEVQDWDALAKNLARQSDVLDEPEDQIRIHCAAGELFAEELGDMGEAIDHWEIVASLEPTHEMANLALDVLLTAEDRWEELAVHLQRRLQHTQDAGAKLEINRRLGVVLGERLGRGEDALTSWTDVLETDPKNLDALRALLPLYEQRALWEELVDIARRLIPLAEPTEAKDARYLLAKVLGENLGEREEAIGLAREVRAQEPHTDVEMMRLGQMLSNIDSFDEAVIAIEKGAALTEDPATRVARYYEATELHTGMLERPNDARSAYESILEDVEDDGVAFAALAAIYRDTEEWRKLVMLHESYVPHADSALRLEILSEIRDTQSEKLGEKELAFIAACRVYKENPLDLAAAEILENIALETDGAEEAAAVLEDETENIEDTEVKIALMHRIARLYSEELQEIHGAEEILASILALDDGNLLALDKLADLGERGERYDKQINALENKVLQVEEDNDRKGILFEIARIWEDRIGELDESIDVLNRILEIDGADPNALDALTRVYAVEERWSELAHVLTRKVELEQDPARNIELRIQVAQLCEGELEDQEAAIMWYAGVLGMSAENAIALASLDRLYTGLERWTELIQIFELQIVQAADREEQISLLAKMGSIYESEFESSKDAVACYERCFAVDTNHLATIKNLERLLRIQGDWNRLIEILEHHINLLGGSEDTIELYLQIGEIYYRELSRVDKAEQVYNRAREVNPTSDKALHALGQLYERSGNWFQSLEMLQREADAKGADPSSLGTLMRIGRINEDMLMDLEAAQSAYRRALEIEPTYAPALQAMKEIAKGAENWEAYAEHLITEAETAEDPEDKTELFVEAAEYFLNVRDEEMTAVRYYQRAIEITPKHLETSRALAEIFFRNEMWDESREMYEVVVESVDRAKDTKDFCQKNYRLGYISEKLGENEQSLGYYKQAFEADATYLPALEGFGQALLHAEDWEEAQKVFQTILIHHRDSLTESEIVDVQAQLGEICLHQNQPDRAYKQFQKALEVDPDHADSLGALAKLDQQMENWEGAYAHLSRLGDVAPGPERAKALLRMSEIGAEQLADVAMAIEPLERARRLKQADGSVLLRLAVLHLEGHQAPKALEVLEEATEREQDPNQLSELNFKLAQVYETEIKHEPMAVQKYNAALDASAVNVKAFEAIERILGNRQEWALLEENYRAQIARAKNSSPQIRLVLWRNLGELYRQALRSVDDAIMAYEVIRRMDPSRTEEAIILAELYALKPDKRAMAIDMQHDIVPGLDNPVAPIRSLRKLYHASQEFDAVYVLCSVLGLLNASDDEEKQIFEYLSRGVPSRGMRGLMEEQWTMVKHPDLNNPVGRLATELYKMGREIFMVDPSAHRLKKKDRVDVRQSDLYFASMMRYVSKTLSIQGVDLYRKTGSPDALYLANLHPPALVVGENNEIFRNTNQSIVLFHAGRTLSYARPEMFLARAYAGEEFRDLLYGLCVLYNRQLQHNGHPTTVERWATLFERLPQQALQRLQPMVMQGYQAIVQGAPFESYVAAVEHTANRAGLLASGNLMAAGRGVQDAGEGASPIQVPARLRELVYFASSRTYMQLRKALGMALQPQGTAQPGASAQAPAG